MATWPDVVGAITTLGATNVGGTMWHLKLKGMGPARMQQVFVFYEVVPPDFEIVKIASPVTLVTDVHAAASTLPLAATAASDVSLLLRSLGQLQIGSLGYMSNSDDGQDGRVSGSASIGTTIPLALLNLSDPVPFLLYLSMLARAADGFEQQYAAMYGKSAANDFF